MFDVSISVEDNKILGGFVADSYFFEPSKYEYAFYLYKDDKRIDTVWYSKSMQVTFDLKGMNGKFFIKTYIKDIEYGDKRSFNSENLSISN